MNTLLESPALLVPEITDDLTRRRLLGAGGGLAAGLLVGGCADDSAEEALTATPSPTAPATRTFADPTGTDIEIPVRPQRIVLLDDTRAPEFLHLGVGTALVGMPVLDGEFREEYTEKFDLSGIESVGPLFEPDLERIAALRPDLLVQNVLNGEPEFDTSLVGQLAQIAPLVSLPYGLTVEENTAAVAVLLGEAAMVDPTSLRAEYEAALGELRSVLGDRWAQTTVSMVDYRAPGNVLTFDPTVYTYVRPFADLGVRWPAVIEGAIGGEVPFVELSEERLGELDADLIISVTAFRDSGAEITDVPTFAQLPAVEAGQVIDIDYQLPTTYPDVADYCRDLTDRLLALGDIRTDLVEEEAS